MKKLQKSKAPVNKNPDWIFHCLKCGHLVYVGKGRIRKMLKIDCPSCGEEAFENWVLDGEGDFNKFEGIKISYEKRT